MNTKKIKDLIAAINGAYACTIDNSPLLMVIGLEQPENNPNNVVVLAKWTTDNLEYEVKFTEQGLNDAVITENKIFLKDVNGNSSEISLFDLKPYPITFTS